MSNILFFARYYTTGNNHLAKKFAQQICAFENLGYCVYVITISGKEIRLCKNNEVLGNYGSIPSIHIPLISNYFTYVKLYRAVERAILNSGINFDVMYCRSLFPIRSAVRLLQSAKQKHVGVISEIPTYPPMEEYVQEKRVLRCMILKQLNDRNWEIAQYVNLFTLIGKHSDTYLSKPAVNISNGIDVDTIPIRKRPMLDCEFHIILLATMATWHGYDRIIEGVRNYVSSSHEYKPILHFVGGDSDGSLSRWKALIEEYGLTENARMHGPLYGKALDEQFDMCHVASASLGLHRIHMINSSVLKAREYTARGIPFVSEAEDTSFPADFRYIFHVSQDEEPIDIAGLIAFYMDCVTNKNAEFEMRALAIRSMSWERQLQIAMDRYEELNRHVQY